MYLAKCMGRAWLVVALVGCEYQGGEEPPTTEIAEAPIAPAAERTGPVEDRATTETTEAASPAAPERAGPEDEIVIDSPQAAEQAAANNDMRATYKEAIQHNAEGEAVRVYVPDTPIVAESDEGGPCGTQNAQGVALSCMPGTYCLKASDEAPGACVRAPQAPRFDG